MLKRLNDQKDQTLQQLKNKIEEKNQKIDKISNIEQSI